MRVAAYIAWGVHRSGRVRYRTSSQLLREGMTLKALGNFPAVYRLKILPMSVYTSTTLGGRSVNPPSSAPSSISPRCCASFSSIFDMMISASVFRSSPPPPIIAATIFSSSADSPGAPSTTVTYPASCWTRDSPPSPMSITDPSSSSSSSSLLSASSLPALLSAPDPPSTPLLSLRRSFASSSSASALCSRLNSNIFLDVRSSRSASSSAFSS
mmetsp:Transcript_6588/g.13817  ORF Transcript_6588/g.13817 Transcript_6588/m.13817 type:complete len:213 (-) Transcript_6588:355-993(-)